jgi:oligoendopeptidase F
VKRDLELADSECAAFEQDFKGRLAALAAGEGAGKVLAQAVKRYEAIAERLHRLMSYASLVHAENITDSVRTKFFGDIDERVTAASLHLLFFTLELNRIDDTQLEAAMRDPALGHYRPWIEDVRKEKPYQLEDRVEELFHEKSVTGYSAWNRLFDETIASLRFKVAGKTLAIEQTLNLLQDVDGKKRRAAAEALAKTFRDNLRPFTLITNTLAKDKEISDRWHGFKDVADRMHLSNRVEPEVVEALVSAVRAAYPKLSHRYYALKAKWFGKKRLPHWDRNAPLPKIAQRTIPWGDARATVLTAYGAFSPKMADVADQFFTKRWIDAPVRPGKQPGAFSASTVPSVHPYVLLNYMGKPRDVMTLAHELGHGVHQVLAAPNGPLMAQTPLTLARNGIGVRRNAYLPQAARGNQGQEAAQGHARRQGRRHDQYGGAPDRVLQFRAQGARRAACRRADRRQLCELWMSVQGESLGPAIELKPGYETFWVYIPHFVHSPFYVYAYAFGDCLVNSLYAVYEKSSSGFAERYLEMLAAGGTKHHAELLAPFGLDARDPKFWDGGLSVIAGLIDELEALE